MSMTRNGVFIVFEGIDGSGKSTQINLLADLLKKQAYDVVETREPTDGSYGRKIRSLYLDRTSVTAEEEIELFIKDRRQHIEQIIEPALSGGKIVLCDRYYFSTAAYQGAAGGDPDAILARHDFAPVPDLVIIIEIDPRLSITRITEQRGDVLNDFEQLESLKKVDSIFKNMDLPYIKRIDGSVSEDEVHQKVRTLVEALLRRLNIAANRELM
jgi:dTMP kinase